MTKTRFGSPRSPAWAHRRPGRVGLPLLELVTARPAGAATTVHLPATSSANELAHRLSDQSQMFHASVAPSAEGA